MTDKLSLREKIGQLIVVRTTGYLFDHQIRYPAWEANQTQLQRWLSELNIGGVILLGGSCAEIAYRTQQLQSWAKTPLFVSADIEEGVGQRFTGASWFPPPMALSQIAQNNYSLAIEYAYQMGKITAEEASAIGINWILAPVTDVNNNPDNPVINVRAFGDNPQIVADLATAFIQGCQSLPILTTAKHFPGHGDTATDSHLDLPRLSHSLARLNEVELQPFQKVIDEGVDTVMTAHLLVESFDKNNPATLSSAILTTQLREKMGFDGLIVTDALIMGGVAKYASTEEIAVKAILAGADILLMPENPEVAIDSLIKAIDDGIISSSRIDRSLARIQTAKEKLFTHKNDRSQPLAIDAISSISSQKTVKEILNQSTIIDGNIPLKTQSEGINLVVVDDLLGCDFLDRQTAAITIPTTFNYQTQIIEQKNLYFASQQQSILLQIFIRGNPFKGSAGLTQKLQSFYQQLVKDNTIEALVIYGSPYVQSWFRSFLPVETPWVFSYGQMPEAQTIVHQKLFGLDSDVPELNKGDFL